TKNTITKDDGVSSVQTRFFISSLGLDVKEVARAVRGHWMVDGIVVTHTPDGRGSGVSIGLGGTVVMVDGEISGNTSYDGGGVYNGGNFTMLGGKISGNVAYVRYASSGRWGFSSVSGNGGGMYNEGVFEISGGVISDNMAYRGGGVYNSGDFTMSGGLIFGNKADYYSDVYNVPDSTVDKSGGVVFSSVDAIRVAIWGSIVMGVVALLFLYLKKK
ncbi:MAG: hypothetical protein FWD52_06235, partial [Candidatus Bathyarchaeota archaeon]|nr:hypothetical protein [Candidatus Termiticorpusculum sp.]